MYLSQKFFERSLPKFYWYRKITPCLLEIYYMSLERSSAVKVNMDFTNCTKTHSIL